MTTVAATGASNGALWSIHLEKGRLEAHFHDEENANTHVVNLTRWLVVGEACMDFADAFCRSYVHARRSSRFSAARDFTAGIIRYLVSKNVRVNTPDDVPSDIGTAFVSYLKRKNSYGKQVLALNTQLNHHKTYKKIAQCLHKIDPRWNSLSIAAKPFAGLRPVSQARPLDREKLTALVAACADQATRTMDQVWPLLPKVAAAIGRLQAGSDHCLKTPEGRTAWILEAFDGNFPRLSAVRELEGLAQLGQQEYDSLRRLAHPIGIDLIPFFLLLALHTGFNQQPLCSLLLNGISESEFLGQKRILLKTSKYRSGRGEAGATLRRAFSISGHPLSPERLIRFVIAWTERLRLYAPENLSNHLFLHAISEGGRFRRRGLRVDSYAAINDHHPGRVSDYILLFCRRLGLKYSGTRDSRLAFAELVDEVANGDPLELKKLLGHRHLATGQDYYRTTSMQQKSAELLGGAMAAQQRWVHSSGRVDSRTSGSRSDRSAATPGFACADPYQSPQLGQRVGRLCASYGSCPACPLALADADAPYALARFLQLREAYRVAQTQLGIEVWKLKFHDSYQWLTHKWIPALDSVVNREAAKRVVLTRLPLLE